MKFATHGNGKGLDDLYIMPESGLEREALRHVIGTMKKNGYIIDTFTGSKGSDFAGILCYDVPMGEWMQESIETAVKHYMEGGSK